MNTEYVSRNHNQAYLRHQNKRAIKKKERIIQEVYKMDLNDFRNSGKNEYTKGVLRKGKVHCGCEICKPDKKFKKDSHKVKSKKRQMDKEIKDYIKWDSHI